MRVSAGIACFRKTNKWQILLVKKRHTYNFASFVKGEYSNNNESLIKLFRGMTIEEKQDIWFGDFDFLFSKLYGITGGQIATNNFRRKYENMKNVYNVKFANIPRNVLRKLMKGTRNSETFWELPKGRLSYNETELECAKREFSEETGINISEIRLIEESIMTLHSTHNSKYKMIIYPALYISKINRDNFLSIMDFSKDYEIVQCDWHNIDDLNRIYINSYNVSCIHTSFKRLQKIIYGGPIQESNRRDTSQIYKESQ